MDVRLALSTAWARTSYLLFQGRGRSRWWSFALLAMLAGSSSVGLPNPGGPAPPPAAQTISLLPPPEQFMTLATIAAVTLLVAALASWVASVGKMVFVEDVVHDKDAVVEPMGRLAGLGTSFFLGTGVINLAAFAGMGWLIAGALRTVPRISQAPTSGELMAVVVYFISIASLLTPILLFLTLFNVLSNELVAPVMYHENVGVVRGWARVTGLMLRRPGAALIWLGLRLLLGMVSGMLETFLNGIVVFLVGAVTAIPAIVAAVAVPDLWIPALLGCGLLGVLLLLPGVALVAAPFAVFWRCFALSYLQQVDAGLHFLNADGRGRPDGGA